MPQSFFFVIPAKAGIHHLTGIFRLPVIDPRLRGRRVYDKDA
jgi:hypothetical protein